METSTYPSAPVSIVWSTAHKIGFRFAFILFILFALVFSNVVMPLLYPLAHPISEGLHLLTPWIGAHLLHLPQPITIFTNGSGDTTYDFVNLLLIFTLAVAGCLLWTALAPHSTAGYPKLYYWLTVLVRYYLGFTLIMYASVKLLQMQFPHPGYARQMQTYGQSSPMGLAWTFYGYSRGYNFVMGLVELCGITLLFRRLVTFGAVVALFTSLNIMAINYFFDVPVKLLSTAMVIMSLFLLSPNFVNLYRFLFKDEAARLFVVQLPAFKLKWLRLGRVALKVLLLVYVTVVFINMLTQYRSMQKPLNTLYGAYKADASPGEPMPPGPDSLRWKNLAIEQNGYALLIPVEGKGQYLSVKQDTKRRQLLLAPAADVTQADTLNYRQLPAGGLALSGNFKGRPLRVSLSRLDSSELEKRGFHWVNEHPYSK